MSILTKAANRQGLSILVQSGTCVVCGKRALAGDGVRFKGATHVPSSPALSGIYCRRCAQAHLRRTA